MNSSLRRIQHHLSALGGYNSDTTNNCDAVSQQNSIDVSQCSSKDTKQKNDVNSSNDIDPPKYPFHLAIPVHDLKLAREFYGGKLGLEEGRSANHWIDYNLYYINQVLCNPL